MKFPFVSRSHHEDVVGLKDVIIATRENTIAEMSKELHRLKDLIFKNNFGVQIHDTLPADTEPVEEPIENLTPQQQDEKKYQEDKQYRQARLASTAITRPSALGSQLAREIEREQEHRANAAHPARQVFAAARADVPTGT